MDEPNFTGAQKAAFQRAVEEKLIKYVRTIELRKWAVAQALEIFKACSPPLMDNSGDGIKLPDPMPLTKEIYDFVRSE